jgi:predicted NAD/FAD-binding protein
MGLKKIAILSVCSVLTLGTVLSQEIRKTRVAIIGGGMAGVSAAHFIQEIDKNAEISVFEKMQNLGGNGITIKVQSPSGKEVFVDAGPQYFAEGPWDNYIQFLKDYNVYNKERISKFEGSFIIKNTQLDSIEFVSPLSSKLRGEKIKNLKQFLKFYSSAHAIYKHPEKNKYASIGEFVENLDVTKEFKNSVVVPFLAASLGTTTDDILKTSTVDIVKLFAFNKALGKNEFMVFNDGMGTMIQLVGNQLKLKGVDIQTTTEVIGFRTTSEGNEITFKKNGVQHKDVFDFIVFAVHADQAKKIFNSTASNPELVKILENFKYFEARIVIHKDSSFVDQRKHSFLNIYTENLSREVISSTMNLGMINSDLNGLYKSWMNEKAMLNVKAKDLFIHQEIFYHPLITPEFNAALKELKQLEKVMPSIHIAGGWSEGLETQETAVLSGKSAAEKYKMFLSYSKKL